MPTWKRIVTDGITLADIGTPASDDKILIQDTSASDAIKYVPFSDVTGSISGTTFAADLKIGRDADNLIDFTTDNQVTFRVSAGDGVVMKASGEIEATSLDISGDVDVDGTLEADAITINGTAIASVLSPVAGNTSLVTTGALDAGSITSGFGNIDVGSSNLTATGTISLGLTSFNDNNITNVGDINADSISVDAASEGLNIDFSGANTAKSFITIGDNLAEALVIQEGTNDYLQIVTTDTSEAVKIGTGVDGAAITIGHTTSEVTIGDNLTVTGDLAVTGDLTVSGTTTTINTTNLEVEDHIILLATNASPSPANGNLSGIEVETSATAAERPGLTWTKDIGASNTGGTAYDGSGAIAGLTGWACNNHLESNIVSHPIAIMDFSASSAPTGNSAGVGSFHYDTGTDLLYIRTA